MSIVNRDGEMLPSMFCGARLQVGSLFTGESPSDPMAASPLLYGKGISSGYPCFNEPESRKPGIGFQHKSKCPITAEIFEMKRLTFFLV